jgi:hypothetical protein
VSLLAALKAAIRFYKEGIGVTLLTDSTLLLREAG